MLWYISPVLWFICEMEREMNEKHLTSPFTACPFLSEPDIKTKPDYYQRIIVSKGGGGNKTRQLIEKDTVICLILIK